jgi:class 3 adenylate cyclase
MVQQHVERKLTAVLIADVAGYSRLMELDEEGTHARLSALQRELLRPEDIYGDGVNVAARLEGMAERTCGHADMRTLPWTCVRNVRNCGQCGQCGQCGHQQK